MKISANQVMNWTVLYYSARVREQVFDLPAGVLADYQRLLELLQEFGANLRFLTRARWEMVCSNCVPRGWRE